MTTVTRTRGAEVEEVACKSVLNQVHGMPFPWSINPYQGCYHQCVFCYARATHRYRELDGVGAWGSRLRAKVNAPEAGATFAWHGVLNLGEVTRDAFFGYLDAEQPQLVATYREMYRMRYAPAAHVRAVERRAAEAHSNVTFAPPPRIVPAPPRELSLF